MTMWSRKRVNWTVEAEEKLLRDAGLALKCKPQNYNACLAWDRLNYEINSPRGMAGNMRGLAHSELRCRAVQTSAMSGSWLTLSSALCDYLLAVHKSGELGECPECMGDGVVETEEGDVYCCGAGWLVGDVPLGFDPLYWVGEPEPIADEYKQ